MIKIPVVFALMTMVPSMCWALSDACTNPKEYTIERRCYLTEDAWQRAPYKHVLKMWRKADGKVYCTANMVFGQIVTARHCIEDYNVSDLKFIAFDGREITVKYVGYENEFAYGKHNPFIDIVFLTPSEKDADFVKSNSINTAESINSVTSGSFVSVGCGGLKILSDKEIDLFQHAYSEFLQNNKEYVARNSDEDFGKPILDDGKTMNLTYLLSKEFYEKINPYLIKYGLGTAEDIFTNDSKNIKASLCDRFDQPDEDRELYGNCSGWHGDSGGGVYRISNGVNGNNILSSNLCNGTVCGLLGVQVAGLSFISKLPNRHLSPVSSMEPIMNTRFVSKKESSETDFGTE